MNDLFPNPTSKPAQLLAEFAARRRELLAQERDELTRLDHAREDHTRLARVIAEGEARALALGETAPQAQASSKLDKLAKEIDTGTATSDRLGRAILTLDEEARRVTMTNADELVAEAVAIHDHARERVTQLIAELNEQQAALRAAYVAAQSVLSTAGRNTVTADLSVPPTTGMLVREGGAPALLRDEDRALAV
jgi:hypothetical protein